MATPSKPKNLRQIRLTLDDNIPDNIDGLIPWLKRHIEELNHQHSQIAEQLSAQAGHAGTVGLKADLDLGGFRVINAGKAKGKKDLLNLETAQQVANGSANNAVQQLIGLSITDLDGADQVLDTNIPGPVTDLTLGWKKKAGWIARYGPPNNAVRTLGYFVSFFNDTSGTVWMNPDDGTVVASQVLAERFVDATHYTTNLGNADPSEPFLSTGVKVRVVPLVKIHKKGKVRGPALDYPTLILIGGDPGITGTVFTGTAVPKLPMALERTAAGDTGSSNSPTQYQLDAGASSEVDAYVGSGDLMWAIYFPTLGVSNAGMGLVTAYNPTTKYVTVTNLGTTVGGGITFELHRGLGLAGISSTGHSTTQFKLDHSADSRISTTTNYYKGWCLYIPSIGGTARIMKVTSSSYAAPIHTLTYEPFAQQTVPGGAPVNGATYMLCKGSFGFANLNATGIISPAPFRVWLDTDLTGKFKDIVESLPPVDFNLQKAYCEMWKQSASKIKYSEKGLPDTFFQPDAPTYVPMLRMWWRNLYRGNPVGTSDGLSDKSCYVPGYQATDTPVVYAPSDFPWPDPDYQGIIPF